MKIDNKFNNYSLTDEEFQKVIGEYIPFIKSKTKKVKAMQEDCMQDIIISLHHTLTKNREK